MSEYKIKDESRSRYFMMPNVLDELGLSVYAFRLYSHYKRVAGENGTCWQSVKTMAEKCNMSMGSITNARRELEEKELIIVKEVPNPTGKAFLEVTIIDVWDKNKDSYSPHEGGYSPHEQPHSPSENPPSPHEIKNTPLINTPLKNTSFEKPSKEESIREPCDIDGIPNSWKKEEKKSPVKANEYRLAETIAALINIKPPVCKTQKDYKAANVTWWSPIKEMLRQVDDNVEQAELLAEAAINTALSKKYVPSSPKSLHGWYMSELAAKRSIPHKIIGKTPDGEVVYG